MVEYPCCSESPYLVQNISRSARGNTQLFRIHSSKQISEIQERQEPDTPRRPSPSKEGPNRCSVYFFKRFSSFPLQKLVFGRKRFAAHPCPEKLASSHSSYLGRAHFGSLAHPQSYRSRSVYLECTHFSTSISACIISGQFASCSSHSKRQGLQRKCKGFKDNFKDTIASIGPLYTEQFLQLFLVLNELTPLFLVYMFQTSHFLRPCLYEEKHLTCQTRG